VNTSISKEREKNAKIKRLLANIKNTENGSEILIDDSKKEYNTQYYINIELVIGIFILGSALTVFFRKKAV
jgi:F0F1-type ATP synthase assembly protein I